MQIAMIGLGRMGKNMALKLKSANHDVVCWNRSPEPREEVAKEGCRVIENFSELNSALEQPRVVWLMLPSGKITEDTMLEVLQYLDQGDILINGANEHFTRDHYYATRCGAKGVHYMDVGVSGGTLAVELGGYCCMVGGPDVQFAHIEPLIRDLSVPDGYGHFGNVGAGHYVKMVHNAIEYAHMQAIGEGFELLKEGKYKGMDLHKVASVWNHGSILTGTLMTSTERALREDQDLKDIEPYIADTGETRWTVYDAIEENVAMTQAAQALFQRFQSREKECFAWKLIAAQRNAFGGHEMKHK